MIFNRPEFIGSCEAETCTAESDEGADRNANLQVQQAALGKHFNPRRLKFEETLTLLRNDYTHLDRSDIKERYRYDI